MDVITKLTMYYAKFLFTHTQLIEKQYETTKELDTTRWLIVGSISLLRARHSLDDGARQGYLGPEGDTSLASGFHLNSKLSKPSMSDWHTARDMKKQLIYIQFNKNTHTWKT